MRNVPTFRGFILNDLEMHATEYVRDVTAGLTNVLYVVKDTMPLALLVKLKNVDEVRAEEVKSLENYPQCQDLNSVKERFTQVKKEENTIYQKERRYT
jgi:hypothetical protein